jgi:hypothetical protein
MQWDLGLQALAIVSALSLGFGAVAHLIVGRANRWTWLIGAVAYFAGAVFVSEVLFATATEAELQPQIDGLSFDEALLGGLVVGLVAVVVTWFLGRQTSPDSLGH